MQATGRILMLLVALVALLALDVAMRSTPGPEGGDDEPEHFPMPQNVRRLMRVEQLVRPGNLQAVPPDEAEEIRDSLRSLADGSSRVLFHEIRILEALESTQLTRVFAYRSDPLTRALLRGIPSDFVAESAVAALRGRALPGYSAPREAMPPGWRPGPDDNARLQVLIEAMGHDNAPRFEEDDELLLGGPAGASIRLLRMAPKELLLCLYRLQGESDEPARERQAARLAAHAELMADSLTGSEARWLRLEARCQALEAAGLLPRLAPARGDHPEIPFHELVTRVLRLTRS